MGWEAAQPSCMPSRLTLIQTWEPRFPVSSSEKETFLNAADASLSSIRSPKSFKESWVCKWKHRSHSWCGFASDHFAGKIGILISCAILVNFLMFFHRIFLITASHTHAHTHSFFLTVSWEEYFGGKHILVLKISFYEPIPSYDNISVKIRVTWIFWKHIFKP